MKFHCYGPYQITKVEISGDLMSISKKISTYQKSQFEFYRDQFTPAQPDKWVSGMYLECTDISQAPMFYKKFGAYTWSSMVNTKDPESDLQRSTVDAVIRIIKPTRWQKLKRAISAFKDAL